MLCNQWYHISCINKTYHDNIKFSDIKNCTDAWFASKCNHSLWFNSLNEDNQELVNNMIKLLRKNISIKVFKSLMNEYNTKMKRKKEIEKEQKLALQTLEKLNQMELQKSQFANNINDNRKSTLVRIQNDDTINKKQRKTQIKKTKRKIEN